MSSVDDLMRLAAGRPVRQFDEDVVVDGNLGVGVGAGAVAPRREPSESISDQIRRAANVVRGRISVDELFEARR